MAINTIQIKRGPSANLGNITPLAGEPIYVTDTKKIKFGDGATVGGLDIAYLGTELKGATNGLAELDATGKIPQTQIPAIAVTDVYAVASEVDMINLTAQEGDIAIRTDVNKTFVHNGGTVGDATDWSEMLTPTDSVTSVNGQTGAVTLALNDISDVNAAAPVNNQILMWNNTTNVWEPVDPSSVTVTQFTSLSDTPNAYAAGDAGKFVRVNSTEDALEFSGAGLNDLSDVLIVATPTDGQVLTWNNTSGNWEPSSNASETNLGLTQTATDVTVTSDTGTDAIIPTADATNAGVMTAADKSKLDGIAAGAEVNVQADWSVTDTTSDAYIANKPTDLTDLSTHNIEELSNVTVTTPAVDDYLTWNGTAWVNTAPTTLSIDELNDVDTTTTAPTTGQTLKWDGTNWVPADDNSSVASLNDIGDVTITSATDGQIITWDSVNSVWVNSNLPTGVDGTFSGLTDTPASYTGSAGFTVKVNATEDALEFVDESVVDGGAF